MKKQTKGIFIVLHVVAWIIFVGLGIKAGALIVSFIVSLADTPEATRNLYLQLNLSSLYNYDKGYYILVVSHMVIIAILKAFMLYQVILIFMKLNIVQPFSKEVSVYISRISYVALGIGLITGFANNYCEWLAKQGVVFPDMDDFLGGGGEFLLLGGVVFMIAVIFKKGIEIQSEHELTI
jgi:hypothetical protein